MARPLVWMLALIVASAALLWSARDPLKVQAGERSGGTARDRSSAATLREPPVAEGAAARERVPDPESGERFSFAITERKRAPKLPSKHTVAKIVATLEDELAREEPRRSTILWALRALGRHESPAAVDALVAYFEDERVRTAQWAAVFRSAFEGAHDPRIAPAASRLIAQVGETLPARSSTTISLMRTLVEHGGEDGARALLEWIDNSDARLYLPAIEAVRHVREPGVREELLQLVRAWEGPLVGRLARHLARGDDPRVRAGLEELVGDTSVPLETRESVFRELVRDADGEQAWGYVESLRLGTPEQRALAVEGLSAAHLDGEQRELARRLIVDSLSDADPLVVEKAVWVLVRDPRYATTESTTLLEALLATEDDPQLRGRIESGLERVRRRLR